MKPEGNTEKSAFEQIVEHFRAYGVEFLVIGGQAETLHGSARVTYDTALCYRRTRENLVHLAGALAALRPTPRGAPPELRFRLDAEAIALGNCYTFNTPFGALDLIGFVEPLGSYEDLVERAEIQRFGDSDLKVISLDDLIRIKQHINRPKDRDSLMHLLAIKRIRESG